MEALCNNAMSAITGLHNNVKLLDHNSEKSSATYITTLVQGLQRDLTKINAEINAPLPAFAEKWTYEKLLVDGERKNWSVNSPQKELTKSRHHSEMKKKRKKDTFQLTENYHYPQNPDYEPHFFKFVATQFMGIVVDTLSMDSYLYGRMFVISSDSAGDLPVKIKKMTYFCFSGNALARTEGSIMQILPIVEYNNISNRSCRFIAEHDDDISIDNPEPHYHYCKDYGISKEDCHRLLQVGNASCCPKQQQTVEIQSAAVKQGKKKWVVKIEDMDMRLTMSPLPTFHCIVQKGKKLRRQ